MKTDRDSRRIFCALLLALAVPGGAQLNFNGEAPLVPDTGLFIPPDVGLGRRVNPVGPPIVLPRFIRPGTAASEAAPVRVEPSEGRSADWLVLKNGTRLDGSLEYVGPGGIGWRKSGAATVVEFKNERVAGVLFKLRSPPAGGSPEVVARFRNGDLIEGSLVSLDQHNVTLQTREMGALSIPRERLRTLYFSGDGRAVVAHGAATPDAWMQETMLQDRAAVRRRLGEAAPAAKVAGAWQYFDGAFTFSPPLRANPGAPRAAHPRNPTHNSVVLSRRSGALPDRLEFSFEVTAREAPVALTGHFFAEAGKPGYNLMLHGQGMHLSDSGSRQMGRVFEPVSLQLDGKAELDARHRRVRVLADRISGSMTVVIDDAVIGAIAPKPGPRTLGSGLQIQTMQAATISNLWIAPWNGVLPGAGPTPAAASEMVLLANGDEARGTADSATSNVVRFTSEHGALELPTSRVTMLDFGGAEPKAASGARLRLAGLGVLVVKNCRLENGQWSGESEVAGRFQLPLEAVQEFIADSSPAPAATAEAARKSTPSRKR